MFNVAEPIQNMTVSMALEREGVVTMECDGHDWMQTYVAVASHPYVAVTDDDEAFRIDGIPPGSYKIRAWHEALGELDKDLTIVAGRDTTVNFDVGKSAWAPPDDPGRHRKRPSAAGRRRRGDPL